MAVTDTIKPDAAHAPISFWSLNDRLSHDELARQIDGMKASGWGGFFLHARPGLTEKYMGERWLAAMKFCVEYAKKTGMKAWLYDENGWPSGTASCTIPRMKPEYREMHLFCAFDRIPHAEEDISEVHVYLVKKETGSICRMYHDDTTGAKYSEPREITAEEAARCPEGYRLFYIYAWRAPLSNERFGGGSYTDLLNPEAIRAFIDSTHEKYAELCGDDFGGAVPGIFTDDVTIKWDLYGAKRNAVPWTGRFREIFREDRGYDIADRLCDMFFDTPTSSVTRCDYFKVMNELYGTSYSGQLGKWCEEHGLALTGHAMGNGGYYTDVMYMFYNEQIPATDSLGIADRINNVARRARSVAEQFGKKDTLCEVFAGTGQELSFSMQKRITDYLTVSGVGTLVPHVSLYSLRGGRKRDHPPTFSHHQPWWRENKKLSDYQARLGHVASMGHQDADMLLLDPVESIYMDASPVCGGDEGKHINDAFGRTMQILYRRHVEFAYGSEYLLSRFGQVKDGKLQLGNASYRAVTVPYALTLRKTTLKLLEEFISAGGKVYVINRVPPMCDGVRDGSCEDMLKGACVCALHSYAECVDSLGFPLFDEYGMPAEHIITYRRRCEDEDICLMLSDDANHESKLKIRVSGMGRPYEADMMTGRTKAMPVVHEGPELYALCTLPAGGLTVVRFDRKKTPTQKKAAETVAEVRKCLVSDWDVSFDRDNALTLDRFAVSEDGVTYSLPKDAISIKYDRGFYLKAEFTVRNWDGKGGMIHLECPDRWQMWLNGKELNTAGAEPSFDAGMGSVSVEGAVCEGTNTVIMHPCAALGRELSAVSAYTAALPGNSTEAIYLTGDFTVKSKDYVSFTVCGGTLTKFDRDLTREGMPFYCGTAVLTKSFFFKVEDGARYLLKLTGMNAVSARVRMNGTDCGEVFCEPYECDITDALIQGHNTIEVKLFGSLRNLLGPHHCEDSVIKPFVSPASFSQIQSKSYSLVPFGIHSAVITEVKEKK